MMYRSQPLFRYRSEKRAYLPTLRHWPRVADSVATTEVSAAAIFARQPRLDACQPISSGCEAS